MLVALVVPMTALAGPVKAPDSYNGYSYEELFMDLYGKIKDPANGYFSSDEGFLSLT